MSEFKLTCKYCGKELNEHLNHEIYKHLQGKMAHPECAKILQIQSDCKHEFVIEGFIEGIYQKARCFKCDFVEVKGTDNINQREINISRTEESK